MRKFRGQWGRADKGWGIGIKKGRELRALFYVDC